MKTVRELLDGYRSTCILIAADRLGIFDRLLQAPRDLAQLALEIGVSPVRLRRFLRVLSIYGLIEHGDAGITLTARGAALAENRDGMRDVLCLIGDEYLPAWSRLDHSVASDETAFEHVFGVPVWQHRQERPRLNASFSRLSGGRRRTRTRLRAASALLASVDFSRFTRIADIGGGAGHLLLLLLRHLPHVSGILFDQPHVVEQARPNLQPSGMSHRCRLEGGSFFESVPCDADLYLLQHVLHDWDDDDSLLILRRCRAAMQGGSTLLLLEKVLPADDRAIGPELVFRDLHMMAVLGGRERTLSEYDALLTAADLERVAYTPLPWYAPDVLEARPRP